jgi:hypothetical protein
LFSAGAALKAYGAARKGAYDSAPFFTIVNYEQMRADALEVNARLRPDVVVLDEAQRIKNWSAKTTQAVKRLRSRYAFILTGTPIENRLDELYSLMDFLDPSCSARLFRFNRDYYVSWTTGAARRLPQPGQAPRAHQAPACCAAARRRWKPNCRSAPTATTSSP